MWGGCVLFFGLPPTSPSPPLSRRPFVAAGRHLANMMVDTTVQEKSTCEAAPGRVNNAALRTDGGQPTGGRTTQLPPTTASRVRDWGWLSSLSSRYSCRGVRRQTRLRSMQHERR